MTFEAWQSEGERLCGEAKVLHWQIGDWWIAGNSRYGARAKAAAKGIFGLEFQTLRNAGVVAQKFEMSRRRDALTFKHHAEVAALPPATADAFLAQAEAEGLSTRNLRKMVNRFKAYPSGRPELEAPQNPKDDPERACSDFKRHASKAFQLAHDCSGLTKIADSAEVMKQCLTDARDVGALWERLAQSIEAIISKPATARVDAPKQTDADMQQALRQGDKKAYARAQINALAKRAADQRDGDEEEPYEDIGAPRTAFMLRVDQLLLWARDFRHLSKNLPTRPARKECLASLRNAITTLDKVARQMESSITPPAPKGPKRDISPPEVAALPKGHG
jgi:hypothetical protein